MRINDEGHSTRVLEMTAWFNGILGVILSFWIGRSALGWSNDQVIQFILVNYVLSVVMPLLILKLERVAWMRTHVISSSPRTWILFLTLYFGGNWILTPHLQSMDAFVKMFIPLVLTTGLSILTMGPIQDYFVHKRQRAERKLKASHS